MKDSWTMTPDDRSTSGCGFEAQSSRGDCDGSEKTRLVQIGFLSDFTGNDPEGSFWGIFQDLIF